MGRMNKHQMDFITATLIPILWFIVGYLAGLPSGQPLIALVMLTFLVYIMMFLNIKFKKCDDEIKALEREYQKHKRRVRK